MALSVTRFVYLDTNIGTQADGPSGLKWSPWPIDSCRGVVGALACTSVFNILLEACHVVNKSLINLTWKLIQQLMGYWEAMISKKRARNPGF